VLEGPERWLLDQNYLVFDRALGVHGFINDLAGERFFRNTQDLVGVDPHQEAA